MATFNTSGAVDFDADFWLLQFIRTAVRENDGASTSFTVSDDGPDILFPSVATVTGSGFNSGIPDLGTINGIELAIFGGSTLTITNLNLSMAAFRTALATDTDTAVELMFSGADTINGSAFDDVLKGFGGSDSIYAGGGNDYVEGGDQNDFLFGQGGDDAIYGGSGNDQLTGNADNDSLYGGADNDSLAGDDGNDFMRGGAGNDSLYGGDGANGGVDTADYSDKSAAVVVTLNGSTTVNVQVGGVNEDNLRNIENVNGGSAGDTLTGDELANVLSGNGGADVLVGNGGADTLNGGSGIDSLFGGEGDDTMNGGADNDVMDAGNGNDIVNGDAGADQIFGFSGADRINGGDGADTIDGGFGIDFLTGGAGADNFIFNVKPTKTEFDHITDFNAADDTITLDNAVFKKLKDGDLKAKFFEIGKHADDHNDYLIFNAKKGVLFYDKDGDGSAKQKAIAHFDDVKDPAAIAAHHFDLTKADFFVV